MSITYPHSALNNDTWLACADLPLSVVQLPRGITQTRLLIIDPILGQTKSFLVYLSDPADVKRIKSTTAKSYFLAHKIRNYKPDGDLFRLSEYDTSVNAPRDKALSQYATPSTVAFLEGLKDENIKQSVVYKDINTSKSVSNKPINSVPTPVPTKAGKPYYWTPAPLPHYAMWEYDKVAEAGTGLPEILQPGYIRIGTISFQGAVGPIDLQISQSAQVQTLSTLRQSQSAKRISGNIRKTVEFTLQFPDAESIINELEPFLRQCRLAPFVPVIHREMYEAGIEAIAIESTVVSTVPGFPEVLQLQVRGYQFNWRRYMLDAEEFDLCFNYPLMELWIASAAIPGAPKLVETSLPWDSSLRCYTPDRDWLALVNDNTSPTDVINAQNAFIDPKDSRVNLLYKAVIAVQTGDYSQIPKYKAGDKLVSPVVISSSYGDGTYLGIPLTSQALFRAALSPKTEGGADEIIFSPQILGDGLDTATGELSDKSSPDSGRTLLYTQAASGAFVSGYWGFWKTSRKTPLTHQPNKDPLQTPLGVAAQETLLSPTNPLYLAVPEFEGLVITGVTAQMSNVLAEFSPEDEGNPVFQHLGTSDSTVVFEGYCPELTARLLEDFVREVSSLAIDFRGQWDGSAYGGYCRVENEVARICGFSQAIPVSLTVDTVPNFPSERRITLSLVSFNPGQRRVPDFGTTATKTPTFGRPSGTADSVATVDYNDQTSHSEQYGDLERFVQGVELYPDLLLPSWKTLSRWVTDLPNVWDYTNHKPNPGYEFLRRWNYPKDYWPSSGNEGYRLSLLGDDQSGKGHVSYEYDGASATTLKLEAGAAAPDANREGFADPDFYCAARGDRRRPTGHHRIDVVLQSLLGSNGAAQTKSLYASNDGSKITTAFGDKEVGLIPSADTIRALDAHVKGNFPDGDITKPRLILPVPQGTIRPQISANAPTASGALPATGTDFTTDPSHGGKPEILALVRKASAAYDVPVLLIQCIIHQESSGNPRDHNSLGYSGLMQIKNGDDFVPPGTSQEKLFDPAFNVDAGVHQFAGALKRQKGDIPLALADYNAGQGAVRKYGGVPPYKETQDYIRKITADYARLSTASNQSTGLVLHPLKGGQSLIHDIPKGSTGLLSDIAKGAASAFPDALKGTEGFGTAIVKGASEFFPDVLKGTHGFGTAILKGTEGFGTAIAKGAKEFLPDIGKGIHDMFLGTDRKDAVDDNFQNADIRAWDVDRASFDPEYGEDMFYAMRRSEHSGRLCQAFPSYLVLLVDGGPVFHFWRLSDVFYGLHSAMSIEVFSSRKVATDTAIVTLADPYNNLSAVPADVALAKANDTRNVFGVQAFLGGVASTLYPTDDLARRREEDLRSLMVKTGARLHIRLGFGADASQLPIVFNGQISGVRRKNDVLELTGLGDGAELTNELSPNSSDQGTYVNSGTGGTGENMRNMILDFFLATEADRVAQEAGGLLGVAAEAIERNSAGYFLGGNPWGIEHFGSPNRGGAITDAGECGPNIYSGWSQSPVNVTYATEDWPIIANLIPGLYQAANEDIPQAVREGADKFLQLANGDGYAKSMDEAGLFRKFQGEPIVGISMEGATPWDIISTLRYAATDYVRLVEPFGLRSTLFFGKSYWPLHYRYDFDTISKLKSDLAKAEVGGAVGEFLLNTKGMSGGSSQLGQRGHSPLDDYEVVYRRRPYLQVHFAHSGSNLLASEIETTEEGWSSIVQSLGTTTGMSVSDKMESSYAQFLDVNIYPQSQRQKVVRSGLYSSQNMRTQDAVYSLGTTNPFLSTNILNNHAIGVLHDEVRNMYQGDIVIAGNAWIRPFHLLHLNDEMKKLQGLVEVGEVLHSFSPEGGFTTTIKPDCLAASADPSLSVLWGHALSACGRIAIGNQILKLVTTSTGRHLLRRAVAQSLRVADHLDQKLGQKTEGFLKTKEYTLSSAFRRKWRGSPGARLGAKSERAYQDLKFSVGPIALKTSGTDLPLKKQILKDFDRLLKQRAPKEFGNRIKGRKLTEATYNSIRQDLSNRIYLDSPKELKVSEEKENATLRARIDAAIDHAVGKFNPLDKEGNLIEEDRLLSKITNWIDPYHGQGSVTGDLLESFRQTRSLRWAASTPAARARLTPEVLEAVGEFSSFAKPEELKLLLDKLGLADEEKAAEAIASVLKKSSAGSVATIEDAILKKVTDQESSIAQLETDLKKATGGARRKLNSKLYLERRKLVNLKTIQSRTLASLHGEEAALKADAIAHRILAEEKAGKIIKSVFATYGHFAPGVDQAALGEKTIAGIGKGIGTIASAAEKAKNAKAAAQAAGAVKVAVGLFGGEEIAALGFAARAAVSLATMGGLTIFDRYLLSRHALFVSPLRSCGREFSSGINGHRGLVVGDHLGPMDSLISYFADDTKSPILLSFLSTMLGVSVHYSQDPVQYQELLEGLGIKVTESPETTAEHYLTHLAHLQALNALGYNLEAANFSALPGAGAVGPSTLLQDRKGSIVEAYRGVLQRLNNSPSISNTGGLIKTNAESAGWCARAVKEILVSANVFKSYPGSENANALNTYCSSLVDVFDKYGSTPLASVPDGALVFYNNGANGHVAFRMSDSKGIYLLGNTVGSLKWYKVGGEFTTVVNYYLPKSK